VTRARFPLDSLKIDNERMGYFHPSCNTDQGVKQTRKGEESRIEIFSRTEREFVVCTMQQLLNTGRPVRGLRLSVPVWTRKVVNYA